MAPQFHSIVVIYNRVGGTTGSLSSLFVSHKKQRRRITFPVVAALIFGPPPPVYLVRHQTAARQERDYISGYKNRSNSGIF